MKKIIIGIILLVLFAVTGLVTYKYNQRQLHVFINHIINPSPIIWDGVLVNYQDELICKKQDKGLLFLAWGPEPAGFIGVSKPNTNSTSDSIANVKASHKYEILSEHSGVLDGKDTHILKTINADTKEYTLFIFVKENNIMVMYAGPKDNYSIFKKTIEGIKFK